MNMPDLYETEDIDFPYKIIQERWWIRDINFYWLLAEYSPKKDIAFGYVNLNNDLLAEWGYIDMKEVRDAGAVKDEYWKPRSFMQCIDELAYLRRFARIILESE